MRNPGGVAWIDSPAGTRIEADTFTCKHCNKIVPVVPGRPPEEAGGLCRICWGLVCPQCNAKGTCLTWEAQMEAIEARDRFRRSAGLE